MLLLLDNYDSFTFTLRDYLAQLGANCLVIRNSASISEIESHSFEGIVISPGPETPRKAGVLMQVIERYHRELPILGICLGHQALGEFFGWELYKANRPMHGKISSIRHNESALFENIPQDFKAVRYNSLLVKPVQEKNALDITGTSETKEVMALAHKELPLYGVQFHPEAACTEHGHLLLNNWLTKHYHLYKRI